MTPRLRHPSAPAIVSALAALAVYAVTLCGTFVYDDFDVFALDERLRVPSMWWKYIVESYNGGVDNLYRPLVSITYAIQWLIHGSDRAWPFHAVNWILHAAVAALVAELTRRIAPLPGREGPGEGRSAVAMLAGILFAVHPIHVEAVANIVGRAELLCALGFIGALVIFARRQLTAPRALAIFGCLVVAILSKEQGLLLPPMLLAMALLSRERIRAVEPIAREHLPGDTLAYAPIKP